MQWEFKILVFDDLDEAEKELNQWGRKGWQVAAAGFSSDLLQHGYLVTLQRPLDPDRYPLPR